MSDPAKPAEKYTANLVDIHHRRVFPAEVTVERGRIASIREASSQDGGNCETFLLPGFVDAHVHVESSLLIPSEFGRAAVVHGTVATVSDPHEIANVLGIAGVEFMLASAAQTSLKICFGAPSCVPATPFETAGAVLNAAEVAQLLDDPRIGYLAEVMNFPAVIRGDADMLEKIRAAQKRGKPVDGHAPQLRGEACRDYFAAGVTTDHECVSYEEAAEKIGYGVKILIREGSAARNYAALAPLLRHHSASCMFCSDDLHPDIFVTGHINRLVRRAIADGYELFNVLRAACVQPVEHYRLPVGLLRVGEPADFIEVNNLSEFRVLRTWIDGKLVAEHGQTKLPSVVTAPVNHFLPIARRPDDFRVAATSNRLRVIGALDGELITRHLEAEPKLEHGYAVADPERDLLKIVVVNRYAAAPPAVAFIQGIGLKRGAIASSVAHDSHNLVAVGVDDVSLAAAINELIAVGGGLAVAEGTNVEILPLPVAGLMSAEPYEQVAAAYSHLDARAKELGSPLRAPFMTLSFMALLVIPELKLSDRGLFDCLRGEMTSLFIR
ncbi:adenine deaminase [Anatilimnocola floriformis]|uniref:adenine deaminase n=1 Tax=Anatilimnocola floriformis TaxID=2948575 RepID=UPI0020C45108|nr:adenine deaminase [Anatilimnocola floriformis]